MASDSKLYGQAFNLSNEVQVTVFDIVRQILDLMNSKLTPEIRNEATNEIRHQYLSASKARTLLAWQPLFTLEEGLKRTIAWYERFLGSSRE